MSGFNFFITLLLLWVGHFLVDFMIAIWPVYKTISHLDIATMGIIAGVSAFIGEGMQMVFGSLSDQGYRRTLLIFGVFATTACAFLAYTQSYWILFFLFLVTCIGSGAFHPAALGLVGSLSPKRKGMMIGVFATGGSAGFGCSQLIYTSLYEKTGGQTFWLAIPSILLIVVLVLYRLSGPTIQKQRRRVDLKSFFNLFKNRDISLLYIIQVCNQSLSWGLIFLLPDFLLSRGYDSSVCYGGGHLCYVFGGMLMMVPSGYLADKYSFRKVILIASVIGLGLFYFFLVNPYLSTPVVLGLLFLMGTCIQILNPLIIAFGTRLMPESPGMISGLLMGCALCFAEGIGQGGGGLLTRAFAEDATAKALAILGLFPVIGIGFALMLPRNAKEEVVTKEEMVAV